MHGNTPHAGPEDGPVELEPEERRALRSDLAAVTNEARALLPDGYLVGGEIVEGTDGPAGTVAVRPPVGAVVSVDLSGEATTAELARHLAAAAALETKRNSGTVDQRAR
ncbi:hypothetical protein BRC93_06385 [Halobacteriales archaeon QS_5_70_15]|jgi:hypothetical protein|nr:MAG: hypothetical protein BRC93_06385 [Halobacteriales archaeon QS_5_70_15]